MKNKRRTWDLIWNELFQVLPLWVLQHDCGNVAVNLSCPVIFWWFCYQKQAPLADTSLKTPGVKHPDEGLPGVCCTLTVELTDCYQTEAFCLHQLGDLQTTRQFGLSACVSTVACNNWYEALGCSRHISHNPRWVYISRSVKFSNKSHWSEVHYSMFVHFYTWGGL